MHTVIVHYFAVLREKKGVDKESVEFLEHETVEELFLRLFPGLGKEPIRVGFAINQHHCPGVQALMDGDEVAFIPPLGGG